MGLLVFVRYFYDRIQRCSLSHQDAATAFALYFVYPAILYLLIDKFHGLCGRERYLEKAEAIAANDTLYLYFTVLMRTHKIMTIVIFQADANEKDDEDDNGGGARRNVIKKGGGANTADDKNDGDDDGDEDDDDDDDDEGCTRQKCRVWFHLSQELTAICCVAFLLLVCLPVLAFWFMFLGILASIYSIYSLLRRVWRESHSNFASQSYGRPTRPRGGEDEFEEFIQNFT